jgi:MYXO-CTERM domain-containing protein
MPSGELACVVKPVTCQADTQCLAGWHCVMSDVVATSPACAPGMNCGAAEPAPMPTSGTCQPPYYGAQTGSDLEQPKGSSSGSGTTNGGTPTGTGNTGTGGGTVAIDPSTPENGADGESHESAACQFGTAPASRGAFGILAVLGALLGLSRRRRAQA